MKLLRNSGSAIQFFFSGAYLSDHTDLALGLNSKMPIGFHRFYTSAARLQKVDNHGQEFRDRSSGDSM